MVAHLVQHLYELSGKTVPSLKMAECSSQLDLMFMLDKSWQILIGGTSCWNWHQTVGCVHMPVTKLEIPNFCES
ncbi:hypothetical protein E2C01_029596 [Portunus trituberculatus]|uniref:Uncharacterized protein n=1 Tax=Portunus trituberculatus TaxID=210409 RepID=A0A5B7ESA6_PORTR|nr:hypothetical protein [Portunus trituberculatus]